MFRLILFCTVLLLLCSCKVRIKGILGDDIEDPRDGEVYGTIKLGAQVWMLENMRYAVEGSCLNPKNPSKEYGRLYTWEQAQEVCPKGWHLPSDEEWKELESYLSISETNVNDSGYRGNIGDALKSMSGWEDSKNRTSSSGFNALPAGSYWSDSFYNLGEYACFWSSTDKSSGSAWHRRMHYSDRGVYRYYNNKSYGYSCRCLKN